MSFLKTAQSAIEEQDHLWLAGDVGVLHSPIFSYYSVNPEIFPHHFVIFLNPLVSYKILTACFYY